MRTIAVLFVLATCNAAENPLGDPGAKQYILVDDLVTAGIAGFNGREIKVHGWVAPGSINARVIAQQSVRTFVLQKSGKQVLVVHRGAIPDAFRNGAEVVVTGRVIVVASRNDLAAFKLPASDTYIVEATELAAKCPSRYGGGSASPAFE